MHQFPAKIIVSSKNHSCRRTFFQGPPRIRVLFVFFARPRHPPYPSAIMSEQFYSSSFGPRPPAAPTGVPSVPHSCGRCGWARLQLPAGQEFLGSNSHATLYPPPAGGSQQNTALRFQQDLLHSVATELDGHWRNELEKRDRIISELRAEIARLRQEVIFWASTFCMFVSGRSVVSFAWPLRSSVFAQHQTISRLFNR